MIITIIILFKPGKLKYLALFQVKNLDKIKKCDSFLFLTNLSKDGSEKSSSQPETPEDFRRAKKD